MRTQRLTTSLMAAAGAIAIMASTGDIQAGAAVQAGDTATYEVVFVPSWNPDTHPEAYPPSRTRKKVC